MPLPKTRSPVTIGVTFDAGQAPITVGTQADIQINFNCSIKEWVLLADRQGYISIDVWRTTYGAFPPTIANSIVGSGIPTITNDIKASSINLFESGWNTKLILGDVIRFNVTSCLTIKKAVLLLKVIRTE